MLTGEKREASLTTSKRSHVFLEYRNNNFAESRIFYFLPGIVSKELRGYSGQASRISTENKRGEVEKSSKNPTSNSAPFHRMIDCVKCVQCSEQPLKV